MVQPLRKLTLSRIAAVILMLVVWAIVFGLLAGFVLLMASIARSTPPPLIPLFVPIAQP